MKHQSTFNYNLTRAYPYRWFSWVVIVGGFVAAVLFSILNYAANAFTLTQIYTTDPNGTLQATQWYERAPFSLTSKFVSSCQPLQLSLNNQRFTTHFGWTYTVTNITSHFDTDQAIVQPSLNYLNNTLSDCALTRIRFNGKNTNVVGNDPYWAWENSVYSISVNCGFDHGTHSDVVGLQVDWYPQNSLMNGPLGFVRQDKEEQANLWWAIEMLWAAYIEMNIALSEMTPGTLITDVRFDLSPTGNSNLSDYDFFNYDARFKQGDGYLVADHGLMGDNLCGIPIGKKFDRIGKLLYSTAMADLGASNQPNILSDHDTLQDFLNGFDGSNLWNMNISANATYAAVNGAADNLAITDATLYAQYSCQVPVRKGIGSMLIAVLIADLVLLQALWLIFTWLTTIIMVKRDRTSNYCAGCLPRDDVSRNHSTASILDDSESWMFEPRNRPSVKRKPVSSTYALVSQNSRR